MWFGHKLQIIFVFFFFFLHYVLFCHFFHIVNLVTFCLNGINKVGVLCVQLLLQFLTDLHETLQAFSPWSENMHMI